MSLGHFSSCGSQLVNMQFSGSSSVVVVNFLIMNKIGLQDRWKSIRIVYASKYKGSSLISIDIYTVNNFNLKNTVFVWFLNPTLAIIRIMRFCKIFSKLVLYVLAQIILQYERAV